MKFMLPVLLSLLITTALFSQKAGGSESSVPSLQMQSELPHINSANIPAQTNSQIWSPLVQNDYNGFNNTVYALAVSGDTIYMGGALTTAGGSTRNKIAAWKSNAFSSLGTGVNNTIYAITVYRGKIIAGGAFDQAGGNSISNIAQWNGESWSAIGTGVNNYVYSLAADGNSLYAGGSFTFAGGNSANFIAKWTGTMWSPLGTGVSGKVNAIAVSGGMVYAGGSFTHAGSKEVGYMAVWNGSEWSSLGTGLNGTVNAIEVSDGNVYAGGAFTMAGGNSANYIAKWSGSSWSSLGTGPEAEVFAIKVSGNDIYAGTSTMKKYSSGTWSTVGSGTGGTVYALAVNPSEGAMYVGGGFTTAGGSTANRIAKFTDTENPLPVELTSFSAKRVKGGVELRWTTATEVNNYGFEIERASATGSRNWEKIDFVPGNGNSNSPKQYIYKDNIGGDQSYIYRLKQIDTDGSFVYSGELHVNSGTPASFELKQNFPNPFNPATMISYSLPAAGMVQLKIYSTTGEEVSALVNELQEAGSYQISFNGSGLASGTYLYRITVSSTAGIYTQSRKMILLK